MPNKFSIFEGQVIESSSKDDLFSLLEFIPDNTQKLIRPRDVRDAFLTTWSNSTFKLTSTTGNNKYIGIDSGNPENKDVKAKILLGKRSVGSFDVMSDSLLNTTDTDIFFFNTKKDSEDQDKTKISILAGTNRLLYPTAPYFETVKELNSNSLNFSIVNPNQGGTLNISSTDSIVNINGISFPTIADTSANAGDNKILKYSGIYPFGSLEWSTLDAGDVQIGSTSSETNIYGNPVNLNGFSLEFVDSDTVPKDIGGIKQEESFAENSFTQSGTPQNWPITEVIRKILYPKIDPELELEVESLNQNKYIEINTTGVKFTYSIKSYPRNSNEKVSSWFIRNNPDSITWNVLAQSTVPLSSNPGDVFSNSTSTSIKKEYTATVGTIEYELLVSTRNDITLTPTNNDFGYDFRIRDSIEVIKPYFSAISSNKYSFNGTDLNNLITNINTTKTIEPYPGDGNKIEFNYDGTGYIYIIQPIEYNVIRQIKDVSNGYFIHDIDEPTFSFFDISTSITPATLNYYGGYRIYRSKEMMVLDSTFKLEIIY